MNQNFRRVHLTGGFAVIILLIWQSQRSWGLFAVDWKNGLEFTASIALLGYLVGCLVGVFINMYLLLFQKIKKSKWLICVRSNQIAPAFALGKFKWLPEIKFIMYWFMSDNEEKPKISKKVLIGCIVLIELTGHGIIGSLFRFLSG